jgi:phage terminase small subunit
MVLNTKQIRFCDEYLIDLNGTLAYQRAYGASTAVSSTNGSRLLRNAHVASHIASLMKVRASQYQVDQGWVIESLIGVYRKASESVPVTDFRGNETGQYKFDSQGANRSLELIGKHLGMFADRLKVEGQLEQVIVNIIRDERGVIAPDTNYPIDAIETSVLPEKSPGIDRD